MSARLNIWRRLSSTNTVEQRETCNKTNSSTITLPSNILREFLQVLGRKEKAVILDIGTVVGPNVEYFLELGTKVYLEDLIEVYTKPIYLRAVDDRPVFDEQKFFDENFQYSQAFFDGVICWDSLSFLEPKFAKSFIIKLSSMMKPNSLVLGLFHTRKESTPTRLHKYQIFGEKYLGAIPLSRKLELPTIYQIRDIIQLFNGYESKKFYLMKHNILEVLFQKK